MYALISTASGILLDGIVIPEATNRMRVIAPGFSDVLELSRKGESWFMLGHGAVQLEFLGVETPAERPVVQEAPLTRSAGN